MAFSSRHSFAWTAVIGALLLSPCLTLAGIDDSTPLEERASKAERTAVIRVISTQAERMRNSYGDELIVTRARYEMRERLKGASTVEAPELVVEGGSLDGVTLKVSDQLELKAGDELLAFLDREPGSAETWKPFERSKGLLRVENGNVRLRGEKLPMAEVRKRIKNAR